MSMFTTPSPSEKSIWPRHVKWGTEYFLPHGICFFVLTDQVELHPQHVRGIVSGQRGCNCVND